MRFDGYKHLTTTWLMREASRHEYGVFGNVKPYRNPSRIEYVKSTILNVHSDNHASNFFNTARILTRNGKTS